MTDQKDLSEPTPTELPEKIGETEVDEEQEWQTKLEAKYQSLRAKEEAAQTPADYAAIARAYARLGDYRDSAERFACCKKLFLDQEAWKKKRAQDYRDYRAKYPMLDRKDEIEARYQKATETRRTAGGSSPLWGLLVCLLIGGAFIACGLLVERLFLFVPIGGAIALFGILYCMMASERKQIEKEYKSAKREWEELNAIPPFDTNDL